MRLRKSKTISYRTYSKVEIDFLNIALKAFIVMGIFFLFTFYFINYLLQDFCSKPSWRQRLWWWRWRCHWKRKLVKSLCKTLYWDVCEDNAAKHARETVVLGMVIKFNFMENISLSRTYSRIYGTSKSPKNFQ